VNIRLRHAEFTIFRIVLGRWKLLLSACLFSLGLSGCATMEIPDYPKVPVATYKNMTTIDGLHISAQAMTDKAELNKYFGTDLSVHNVVPIHLIAENKNLSTSFIIAKDKMSFRHRSTTDSLTTGGRVDGKSVKGEVLTIGGAVSLVAVPILAPALIFSGFKEISNAAVVKHNFAAKELQARTLSPGKSIDGFVYFTFPEGSGSVQNWQLLVQVNNLSSKKTQEFVLTLN